MMKSFNAKLYFILVLMLLIPSIYKTFRIYFLGDIPSDFGYNVASQIAWLNILFEVVQEALILPLFYLIGGVVYRKEEFGNRIKTGIISTGFVYLILIIFIFFGAENLLLGMDQKESLIALSSKYIKFESIAILLSVIYRFTLIVLIIKNKARKIFALVGIQSLLTIICDILFLSQFSFSFHLGVLGIAYGNILVSFLLILISIYFLKKENIYLIEVKRLDFSWLRDWFKIGGLSGIESFIRNGVFIVFILKMINRVEGQSVFWLSNSFIWGYLLIPILALGELVKKDVGVNNDRIQEVLRYSLIITTIIIGVWIITIPFWETYFIHLLNVSEPKMIIEITLLSLVFYIAFAYNNIIDSVLYGLGRTDLMLFQSIMVNVVYYGLVFIFLEYELFVLSLTSIVSIFGIGILIDALLTFAIYRYYIKQKFKKIS